LSYASNTPTTLHDFTSQKSVMFLIKCVHPFFTYSRINTAIITMHTAIGYGLDGRGIRIPSPVVLRDLQTRSAAQRAPYPMGTVSSFPVGIVVEA
jgi:hypothetical protein